MAKIKCSDCGKKFDYEIHSGMCPKCGTYTRIDKEVNKESSPDLTRMEKTSVVEKKSKTHIDIGIFDVPYYCI